MGFSRKKSEEALVVAFESTASALAFADAAKAAGLSGRLVPIPRTLSAGCGMAWRDSKDARNLVESILESEDIDDARIVVMKA